MRYLRTNTATIVTVGPFFDKTDGVTLETALTITNERISFTVDANDGNAPTLVLDNVTGATSGTSNDLNYITSNDAGLMQLELSAANVNYLGRAFLTITDAANHCPVFHEFTILPAVVYDSLITGGDYLQVDATQLLGTAFSTPSTAGIIEVNLKNIANAAVSTSTAQLGVNTVNAGGTAWGSGAITAASVATGAIDADAIADGAIDAGAIATGAITSAKFAAGAIDAAAIANAAIDNATFAADVGSTAYATNVIALAADKAIANAALATAANLATLAGYVDTEVAAILADTNELQVDWVNGGRLDLLIDAIKAKTDLVPASPAAVGSAMTLATGAITAAVIATGAIDADALAADAVDEIWDEVMESTLTAREFMRIFAAALAGKSTGGGTGTITFRDIADSKARITATVDGSRNRTAITRDGA